MLLLAVLDHFQVVLGGGVISFVPYLYIKYLPSIQIMLLYHVAAGVEISCLEEM